MKNLTTINDLLFDVEKIETTGIACNSDYSHEIFGYPKGIKTRLNCCSDRYQLVPVSDFLPNIIDVMNKTGLKYDVSYRMIDNAVFYTDIIIQDERFYIGTKQDELSMKISITHSYNGKEKYQILMGTFYRYLCSNGLWMTKFDTAKYGLNIVGKHTVKILDSLQMFENKLHYVLDNDVFAKCVQSFQPMLDNWVENWADRVQEVMKVAAIGTTTNNLEYINSTILSEAGTLYNGKVNDWLIYNGINKMLFDDTQNVALDVMRRAKDAKVQEYLLYK